MHLSEPPTERYSVPFAPGHALYQVHCGIKKALLGDDLFLRRNGLQISCFIYADNVAIYVEMDYKSFAHNVPHILARAAVLRDGYVRTTLPRLGFQLSTPKRNHIAMSPGPVAGGFFRQNSSLSATVCLNLTFSEPDLLAGALPPSAANRTTV